MISTHYDSKRTSTVLADGVPCDSESQPLSPQTSMGMLSSADILEPGPADMPVVDQSNFARAVSTLRYSDCVADRVAAARALGNMGSELATADLIATLFDPEPDVSSAAATALSAIGDPAVNLDSLQTFFGSSCRAHESSEVECLPSGAARRINFNDSQALVITERPLPYHTSPSESNLCSNDQTQQTFGLEKNSAREDDLEVITKGFDDPDPNVRNEAALAVDRLALECSGEYFALIMERATFERRRRIGRAMVGSGLASEAIEMLNDSSRERVHNALKLLSLIAGAGETQPLVKTIEEHSSIEIRRAAVKLLSISGYPEMATVAVRRRLKI